MSESVISRRSWSDLSRQKNSGRLAPTQAGQGMKDRKNHAVAVVPSQRDVTEQSGVLIVKAIFIVRVAHHLSPGHHVEGGSLAEILATRSATRWLRL